MSYHWWSIDADDGQLSDEASTALNHLFARPEGSRVSVREPEVWSGASHWPASEYYDGRLLTGVAATALISKMLASAEFWCRLVTDLAEVHVVEGTVYLGTVGPDLDELAPLAAERVDSSPYAIDRMHFPYYPAADEGFWSDRRRDVESGGEMLILQQWAAGIGGERWFRVASVDDLETVRRDVVPRALFAVFQHPRIVHGVELSAQPISRVLGDELLLANVRVFRNLSVSPLMVESVANDQELARASGSLNDRDAVFVWNHDAASSYAAQPDTDGKVRAAASFQ